MFFADIFYVIVEFFGGVFAFDFSYPPPIPKIMEAAISLCHPGVLATFMFAYSYFRHIQTTIWQISASINPAFFV
jgi:hypothetical protein